VSVVDFAYLSRNCPFSGRLLALTVNASKSVHKLRPATVFRPQTVHHVSETVVVPGLFTHSVVCMTADAMPSDSLPGGAVGCLPRSLRLPHPVQYRLMRRQYPPQRGFPLVTRFGDALVHFLNPRCHLLGQAG